jgi:hypothetical protein
MAKVLIIDDEEGICRSAGFGELDRKPAGLSEALLG